VFSTHPTIYYKNTIFKCLLSVGSREGKNGHENSLPKVGTPQEKEIGSICSLPQLFGTTISLSTLTPELTV